MAAGNAVRRNFPGMNRACSVCAQNIIVTEQMCKRSKYRCGACESGAAVQWAKDNREKKRASNNAWHSRHSSERAASTRQYRDRHPAKKLAHQAVQTARRNGTLTRSGCAVCGSEKTHGHHDDYAKPLDVIWLCHQHHMERHAMLAARLVQS